MSSWERLCAHLKYRCARLKGTDRVRAGADLKNNLDRIAERKRQETDRAPLLAVRKAGDDLVGLAKLLTEEGFETRVVQLTSEDATLEMRVRHRGAPIVVPLHVFIGFLQGRAWVAPNKPFTVDVPADVHAACLSICAAFDSHAQPTVEEFGVTLLAWAKRQL